VKCDKSQVVLKEKRTGEKISNTCKDESATNLWSNLEDQISGCPENDDDKRGDKITCTNSTAVRIYFRDSTKSVLNPSFAIPVLLNAWMVSRWVGSHSFLQKAFKWGCGWGVSRAGVIMLPWLWWWAVCMLWLKCCCWTLSCIVWRLQAVVQR